jgi:hypothetical protein
VRRKGDHVNNTFLRRNDGEEWAIDASIAANLKLSRLRSSPLKAQETLAAFTDTYRAESGATDPYVTS